MFAKKKQTQQRPQRTNRPVSTPAPSPRWSPNVNLETARVCGNNATHSQVEEAIARLVELSEKPTNPAQLFSMMDTDPDVHHRPWIWMSSAMQKASAEGDYHTACAGLYWACHWTFNLVPHLGLADYMALHLDPIPPHVKSGIETIGLDACRQLPEDFVMAGYDGGSITAVFLASAAPRMLNTTR